jgi:CheY-like chemotaxis protein
MAAFQTLQAEIAALRKTQEEILALLRSRPAAPAAPPPAGDEPFLGLDAPVEAPRPRAVRSGRRKSVLVVDDDEQTIRAAVEAFQRAEVPVRHAMDGNEALGLIGAEKPDVIVMELAMGGSMAGKDVINMIKATMEWVDIPVVLYTRLGIEHKEARTLHGADDLVLKGPQGPETLVAKVISIFRKG